MRPYRRRIVESCDISSLTVSARCGDLPFDGRFEHEHAFRWTEFGRSVATSFVDASLRAATIGRLPTSARMSAYFERDATELYGAGR